MGTAIKHHVPDRVKPSFESFDIRALWRSESQITNDGLTRSGTYDNSGRRRVKRIFHNYTYDLGQNHIISSCKSFYFEWFLRFNNRPTLGH